MEDKVRRIENEENARRGERERREYKNRTGKRESSGDKTLTLTTTTEGKRKKEILM